MFRLRLHPTPFGIASGFLVIAFWTLLWTWFLLGMVRGTPDRQARRAGAVPYYACWAVPYSSNLLV